MADNPESARTPPSGQPASGQPDSAEKEPVRVNLFRGKTTSLSPSLSALSARLQTQEPPKEQATRKIGMMLIVIFGFASVFVTWEGFRVIFYSMDKPENTKLLVTEAVIPLIEKIGTFLTTVFGPLLAFILGYYFAQKTEANKP